MAPDEDDAVLPGDLSSDDEEEEEDEDDDVINSSNPLAVATAPPSVTVALPAPPRPRTAVEEKKPVDDSRRLFQRLWTDEDEIELLQGFLDYTTQRGSKGGSHQNDTALFYDQIKSKLQLEFNKNQLVEKLRRLKKKYRNVLNKITSGEEVSFKSPHDQATFEISRKIWSDIGAVRADDEDPNFNHFEIKTEDVFQKATPRPRKRHRPPAQPSFIEPVPVINGGGGCNCGNCNVQGMIEETVKSCMSPLFRELMSNSMGGGSFGGHSINLNFGEAAHEQWRKQQILELEVYSKRLELVQNQIKVALDELRSTGGG